MGTSVGFSVNFLSNYGDYEAEDITGWEYLKSIAVGAATGFLSTIPGTGVIWGSYMGVANEIHEQTIREEDIISKDALIKDAKSFGTGLVAGNVVKLATKIGDVVFTDAIENNIGGKIKTMGNAAGMAANVTINTGMLLKKKRHKKTLQ